PGIIQPGEGVLRNRLAPDPVLDARVNAVVDICLLQLEVVEPVRAELRSHGGQVRVVAGELTRIYALHVQARSLARRDTRVGDDVAHRVSRKRAVREVRVLVDGVVRVGNRAVGQPSEV